MTAILNAEAITKTFGSFTALDSVSLRIDPGEVVAITGASGSGKTTLLHCLAGISLVDSGSVTFGGRDIAHLSDNDRSRLWRTQFGVLFQFGQLIPEMTLAENVALPLLLEGIRRSEALASARDVLDRLGLAGFWDARPTTVSGGQAQRAALARASVTRPAVLFADEPTGALDSESGRVVLDHLLRLAREDGTAIMLVTHDAGVASVASRQVVLSDGRVLSTSIAQDVRP